MYQHAVDIQKVEKDINKLEKKHDEDMKELKNRFKKQGRFVNYIIPDIITRNDTGFNENISSCGLIIILHRHTLNKPIMADHV